MSWAWLQFVSVPWVVDLVKVKPVAWLRMYRALLSEFVPWVV